MNIILKRVEETQKEILYRLLQYSLFEESLNDQNDMNEDALFEYPWFENYFTEKGREACFIKEQESERLLGFVMGYAALSGDAGNKENGNGEYLLPAESVYPLQCI